MIYARTDDDSPRLQAPRKPDPNIAACIALLAELFPKCFSVYEGRRRPLRIGIHNDLIVALDGAVTPSELGRALGMYVHNKVYRSRVRAGAIRIDLNGDPAGAVTPAEAQLFVARPAR